MPIDGLFTDRSRLESLFDELATELHHQDLSAEVVVVGGSWMLWHSRRAATQDIDSARQFDKAIRAVIEDVGSRNDLPATWLNDAAAAFWPSGESYDTCDVAFEQPGLVVRTPSPDVIFIMKLDRADPQDREDMVNLWPLCSFANAEAAVHAYETGFPLAVHDPHLASYVEDIARDADTTD